MLLRRLFLLCSFQFSLALSFSIPLKTLKDTCGQFHQNYISAFAPISLRQKRFNLYFKQKSFARETFAQKNVGEIDPR